MKASYSLILFITLPCLLFAQPASLTPKIPEYFGTTYDIFNGNPLSEQIDPGFKPKQLFKYTYTQDTMTTDGKFYYPQEVTANLMNSCSRSFNSLEVNGLKSYHDALEESVSMSGGYDGLVASVSFTGSVDYKKAQDTLTAQGRVQVLTQEKCQLYEVGLKSDQKLSDDFLASVDEANQKGDWEDFIRTWGTHYASQLVMGASAVKETTFMRETVQQLQSVGINVSAAVTASYGKVSGSLGTQTGLTKEQQSYFDNAQKEVYEYYIGTAPSKSDNATWVLDIENSQPLPLTFTLNYIADLFNSTGFRYFGDKYTPTQLNQMRKAFTDTYRRMITQMGTRVPIEDPELSSINILASTTVIVGGMGGDNFEDLPIPNFFMKPISIQIRSKDSLNGISMTLSDGVSTQVTDWHGGQGGDLSTYTIPIGKRIAKAEIWTHDTVAGIRFILDDGTYSGVYGKQKGDYHLITIYGYLTGFRGRSARLIDSIGFMSNEYSYDPSNPKIVPYATLLYGGGGGSFFMDDFSLDSSDPYLRLRSATYVDNIQLQVKESTAEDYHDFGGYHGGNGGNAYSQPLDGLQSISIWSARYVDALQFKVNGKISPKFGGNGGSLKTFKVSSDMTLVGTYGRSARFVDAIGFMFNRKG